MVFKQFYSTLLVLLLVVSCTHQSKTTPELSDKDFEWKQSYLGGGGYITGLVQNPLDPDMIFARCDVAGLFKSDDAGKNWRLVNKGLQQGFNQNTESVCIHPHQPNVMFRASGEARNHKMVGEIHKSVDGGETWYSVSKEVDFFGNGPNRMMGERIAVDPFNQNFVAAGGFSKGVFVSTDNGETWSYSALMNEPISHLIFHPYRKNELFVATRNDMRMKDYLQLSDGWQRPLNGRLFKSTDLGKTWELIYDLPNIDFTELAFFSDNHDKIVAGTGAHGIFISIDGGSTFNPKNNGLPLGIGYNTVAVDYSNPQIIYTVTDRRGENTHVPLVPIYKSVDGGENWHLLKEYTFNDFSNYPSYIRNEEYIGWAISRIMTDIKNPQRLFMSNWYGVSVSDDGGKSWNGNDFKGTETVCIENLVVDATTKGRSGFVMPDHRPFIGNDFGANYQQIPIFTEYKNSTVLVFSSHNPNFMLYAGKRDWMGIDGSAIMLSRDGGKTFGVVKEFTGLLTVQAIKEDPLQQGTFYAYIDRYLDRGAGLYQSTDWGETWHQLNLELPEYIKTLPHQMNFIENELLSVTYGQQKNVCGTNQLLCVDPHRKGTIYFGEWTEGLFRTSDGGETWSNISNELPFKRDTSSVLIDIKADEKVPGLIYAGFIREGLWRSTNYGDNWEKIFPTDDRIFNASSIAVGGFSDNEIVVASEPLYWSPSESAIYFSNDAGLSFTNIYDNRYGALRWKAIGIDRSKGTIYGVTCGNGAFYANRMQLSNEILK